MAPNDPSDTTDEARHNAPRTAGVGAYPPPHQNGLGMNSVNPFHLAIAELQADTDDMDLPPPASPAAATAPPSRQTVVLTQPVRALHVGNWIAIGLLAICSGLAGGLIIAGAFSPKPSKLPEPTPVIDPALVQDLEGLKTRTTDLLKQVDGLNQKLAAIPAPTPPPDLSGLDQRLGALTQETERLSNSAKRVGDLESSASALSASVGGLYADAKNLRAKLEKLERNFKSIADRPTTAAAPATPERDDKTPGGSGLGQGAELFRKGKYKDALGIFNKLEVINPDDARVWYFAALSHGLATNQWGGGTAELVERGIQRERAGTPSSVEIDAAFQDLTASTGREWLDQYRKRAR